MSSLKWWENAVIYQIYPRSFQDSYADANGNDHFYGFAYKMDLKSLVWYSPEQFEDNGYEIPTTMEGLIELSDQMVADGNTPWCIGVESGNATGWTATDWMEDIMLRTTSAENYDRWVSNDLAFNSPVRRCPVSKCFLTKLVVILSKLSPLQLCAAARKQSKNSLMMWTTCK